jgi:hypothetical protein
VRPHAARMPCVVLRHRCARLFFTPHLRWFALSHTRVFLCPRHDRKWWWTRPRRPCFSWWRQPSHWTSPPS